MMCGKEDLSYFLITEVYKTRVVSPARRHGLVFGLGVTAEKNGPAGNHGEGHAMDHGPQAQPGHSNE